MPLNFMRPTCRFHSDGRIQLSIVFSFRQGGLHNLFGDTNSVHVKIDTAMGGETDAEGESPPEDQVNIDMVIKADTVEQVLSYVQYSSKALLRRVQEDVDEALRRSQVTPAEADRFIRFYRRSLKRSTYLSSRKRSSAALRKVATRRAKAPVHMPVVRIE